jgi:tryptophan synthase alpha chain
MRNYKMPVVSTSRIEARFRDLRKHGKGGLVIYLTAGDPTLGATGELLAALDRGGADVIELGVPFSDPLADGPVIQRASERALKSCTTLRKILAALPQWMPSLRAPVILFSYYNPILQYGLEAFARDASQAGAAGALVVDLTPEEAGSYLETMRRHQLDTIFLASPTSTSSRLEQAAKVSTGFLYLISRTGVTGEHEQIASGLKAVVTQARKATELPLAVGFGIANPEQVRAVQALADAAVVGSAVVHAIEERYGDGKAREIEEYVRWLKEGTGSEPQ